MIPAKFMFPEGTTTAELLERIAKLKPLTAAGWDESKHPRDPGGEGGGEFIEAGTTGVLEQPVMGLGGDMRRAQAELVNDQENDGVRRGYSEDDKRAIEAGLGEFMESADLSMRVPESAMAEMFEDGEFYNQHQSGGARGLERSTEGEANLLGLPRSSTPEQLPKYAYLGPDNSQVNMYGPVKVIFKDNIKDRTTFTVGDSLMTNAIPSKVREPWWGSARDYVESDQIPTGEDWSEMIAEETGSMAYMEAQIYGKLTPNDIERVEVLDEDYWTEEDPMSGMPLVDDVAKMEWLMEELDKRQIPWSTYTPEGDFSGEWA